MKFLIQNEILEKLKPSFQKAKTLIENAIKDRKPIIIRHNADCDGYGAAIAIERALLPLIEKEHNDKRALSIFFKRFPQKAPYYDYNDVLRDLNNITIDIRRFGNRAPLVIVMDNGSTEQDYVSLKLLKEYGCDLMVVDHHPPEEIKDGKAKVDEVLDAHINPHLVGGDSNICTGMLGTELALHLYPEANNIKYLPALTGFSDHAEGKHRDDYLKIAQQEGYNEQLLRKLGEVIDYQAVFLHASESRYIVDDMFGADKNKQKAWISAVWPTISERRTAQLETIKKYATFEKTPNATIAMLDMNKMSIRGQYPATGKSAGLLMATYEESNTPAVVYAYGENFVTLRTNLPEFDIHDIIHQLQEMFPFAQIEGGGHAVAGSMRFIEYAQKDILEFLKKYAKK